MNVDGITFADILLTPDHTGFSSRRDVSYKMTDVTGKLTLDVPIMSSNMDTITEHEMANFMGKKGGIGVLHRFMSVEDNVNIFKQCFHKTFVSVGASEREMERFHALLQSGAEYFCVDVAHGHADYVGNMISRMRRSAGNNICIMAGNVATYEGAQFLAEAGADIIKVGIGPGSVCTTRIKTGFGVPQVTAIQNCARVDRSIVADGGLREPGDIVKALALGADFVMIGGMLAGTRPTPGKVITKDIIDLGRFKDECRKVGEETYKVYRGMASKEVADDYHGGLAEWKTAEGVSTKVPYREDEDAIMADIVGGIHGGMGLGGARTIAELRKVKYTIISGASRVESLPHKTL